MALEPVDGGGTTERSYILVGGPVRSFRVNNDGTTTPIVTITAISARYGVQFAFTLLAFTYDTDGGPPETELRAGWVDAVCGYDHVIGFRTELDQGPDQVLYNYAVITVGPAGATDGDAVTVRMDHLNDIHTFDLINQAWRRQVALGVS